jgi:hypothetical protein
MRDDYRLQIAALRFEIIDRALGMITAATIEAVTTLQELLRSDSEHVKLGAARAILEYVNRLRESVDLERRVAAMEETSR